MKETKVSDDSSFLAHLKKNVDRKTKLKTPNPTFIETFVEIYPLGAKDPIIGANVDIQSLKNSVNPKNLSVVHRASTDLLVQTEK